MSATAATMESSSKLNETAKTEAFLGKVLGDSAGTFALICCAVGDKYGLFKDLAKHGAHTSGELADCAKLNPRYLTEWASCLATAGYLGYDPKTAKFSLPAPHAPVLASEGGPFFLGGIFQTLAGFLPLYPEVVRAFKDGRGIESSVYNDDVWKGILRLTDQWHENFLVQQWVPAVPDVRAKLEAGCTWADIGSGSGKAVVRLAQAFPRSTFVGFDLDEPSIERARALAKASGVEKRVRFERCDLTKGIPGAFDVISAFDVVHDTADPAGVFKNVRGALKPGGSFVVLEINASDRLEDNLPPLGPMFYGISMHYCLSIARSRGGEGLGTAGLHETRVRAFATETGFAKVRRIDIGNPFNVLYEVVA